MDLAFQFSLSLLNSSCSLADGDSDEALTGILENVVESGTNVVTTTFTIADCSKVSASERRLEILTSVDLQTTEVIMVVYHIMASVRYYEYRYSSPPTYIDEFMSSLTDYIAEGYLTQDLINSGHSVFLNAAVVEAPSTDGEFEVERSTVRDTQAPTKKPSKGPAGVSPATAGIISVCILSGFVIAVAIYYTFFHISASTVKNSNRLTVLHHHQMTRPAAVDPPDCDRTSSSHITWWGAFSKFSPSSAKKSAPAAANGVLKDQSGKTKKNDVDNTPDQQQNAALLDMPSSGSIKEKPQAINPGSDSRVAVGLPSTENMVASLEEGKFHAGALLDDLPSENENDSLQNVSQYKGDIQLISRQKPAVVPNKRADSPSKRQRPSFLIGEPLKLVTIDDTNDATVPNR